MFSNTDYDELQTKSKYKSDIIVKTKKMIDLLEEEGINEHFEENEGEDSNILYTSYDLSYDINCLLVFELQPNNINIAKVIFKYEVNNKSEMLKLLNILNNNDMYVKYVMLDNMIECCVKYSAFADDFNPSVLSEYMKICINSINENISLILKCND